jgi:signal transduction histidine kinase
MTAAVVARLFEFFTARSSVQGAGLGLSSCLRIVRGHGGEMTFDSEPVRGTRVDIYLPRRYPVELESVPEVLRDSTVQPSQ